MQVYRCVCVHISVFGGCYIYLYIYKETLITCAYCSHLKKGRRLIHALFHTIPLPEILLGLRGMVFL